MACKETERKQISKTPKQIINFSAREVLVKITLNSLINTTKKAIKQYLRGDIFN